jgi:hypothetical protein
MEVVVSMGIMAVLLLAVQSTIVLASRSIPDARSKATALVTSASALDMLQADLTFAAAILSRSATGITVQVPDRNADGIPETITWSWNGVKGGALLRTVNGGTPTVCAANVQSFNLACNVRTVEAPPTYSASPEMLFLGNTPALLLNTSYEIRTGQRIGQYFKPNLPANATAWAVTRVQILARIRSGAEGESSVQIRPVSPSNLPTATKLGVASMPESSLDGDYAWRQFSFNNAGGLSPTSGAALLVDWVSGSESCEVQGQALSLALSDANMLRSTNGSNWTSAPLSALNCYIYGTYTTKDPVQYLHYITGVQASLLTSAETGATARNHFRLINELQVATP